MSNLEEANVALLVVDVQEDFCPPNGSLAVKEGRDIVPTINQLLSLPFKLKLATKDHHPPNHISFASSHSGKQPFTSFITIRNPLNPSGEYYESRLWPDHCIVGTKGNELLPELDSDKFDEVVLKGCDARVEMYSAFRSPLRNPPLDTAVSKLQELLKNSEITDVVIVGLAGDYCVKSSAVDSAELGWRTWVVGEATRYVDGEKGIEETKKVYEEKGVEIVSLKWVQEHFFLGI
ncbi:isochorismatase family hydrolase [Abortiporus biennis]|nr:isochorismatase family hydrolase [Abortiporus biennis]